MHDGRRARAPDRSAEVVDPGVSQSEPEDGQGSSDISIDITEAVEGATASSEVDPTLTVIGDSSDTRRRSARRSTDRLFLLARDYLFIANENGELQTANPAFVETFPCEIGRPILEIVHPEQRDAAIEALATCKETGEAQLMARLRARSGRWEWVDATLVFDELDWVIAVVGRNVTKEQQLTDALRRRAETDPLTGLANRNQIMTKIKSSLKTGPVTVFFVDLDRFKLVNDSLGHAAGDDLLRQLGSRLAQLRLSHGAMLGRMGGDEFVVVVPEAGRSCVEPVSRKLQSVLNEPFLLKGNSIYVGMSIGAAVSESETDASAESLLSQADTAVYAAKNLGPKHVVVFDELMRKRADERVHTEFELRRAIDEDRVEVHYQPIVRLEDEAIVCVEALARIVAEDGTLMLPDDFLPIATEIGVAPTIDLRVLEQATDDLAAYGGLGLALNVAQSEIIDPRFASRLETITEIAKFDLERMTIELTEASILADRTSALRNLGYLRDAGAKIAIDGFGAGPSSLSDLYTMPIDTLKIDRAFTASMMTNPGAMAVIDGLVKICGDLGINVIAAGAETADQIESLRTLRCYGAQGYYFSAPAPIDVTLSADLRS